MDLGRHQSLIMTPASLINYSNGGIMASKVKWPARTHNTEIVENPCTRKFYLDILTLLCDNVSCFPSFSQVMLGLGMPPAEQLSTMRYPIRDWTHWGDSAVKYGGPGSLSSTSSGSDRGMVNICTSGLGPKLISSYSTQFLLTDVFDELSLPGGIGFSLELSVASFRSSLSPSLPPEVLTVTDMFFPCRPALFTAMHLYTPLSSLEMEDMTREPF